MKMVVQPSGNSFGTWLFGGGGGGIIVMDGSLVQTAQERKRNELFIPIKYKLYPE
jgi:hypothetical protein